MQRAGLGVQGTYLEGILMFIALSLVFVLLAAAVRYTLVALVDDQAQPG